jgi:hypothetical protein
MTSGRELVVEQVMQQWGAEVTEAVRLRFIYRPLALELRASMQARQNISHTLRPLRQQ